MIHQIIRNEPFDFVIHVSDNEDETNIVIDLNLDPEHQYSCKDLMDLGTWLIEQGSLIRKKYYQPSKALI